MITIASPFSPFGSGSDASVVRLVDPAASDREIQRLRDLRLVVAGEALAQCASRDATEASLHDVPQDPLGNALKRPVGVGLGLMGAHGQFDRRVLLEAPRSFCDDEGRAICHQIPDGPSAFAHRMYAVSALIEAVRAQVKARSTAAPKSHADAARILPPYASLPRAVEALRADLERKRPWEFAVADFLEFAIEVGRPGDPWTEHAVHIARTYLKETEQ